MLGGYGVRESFLNIAHNEVLQAAFLAWLIAQGAKTLLAWHATGRFSLERLVGSGGMPSSHSALVVALTTGVGLREGWGSTLTAITVVFSAIVMYDAAGVRRAAGKQARVLNKIVSELAANKPVREERLKELLGHTPFEVIVGALLGVAVALWRMC
ncbi:MAG: divergent PAP2 family protein [Firmicutes bacterium]|nr:divergent PAP2 family protein [Bacillota bacterium]